MSKSKVAGKTLVVQLGRKETQIILAGNEAQLLHGITVETPSGSVEDGMIWNPDAVRDMLKAAMKTPEFRGVRQVVFSLCTSQVITEAVSTPDLPMAKLEKLIQSNMDMYFPVDIKDYHVVWQVIGPRAKSSGMKELSVQLWAVPINMLNRYYNVANACGLSIAAIDYCGNSMATLIGASFSRLGKFSKERKKLDLNREITFGKKKVVEPELPEEEEEPAAEKIEDTELHLLLERDLLGMTFVQAGQVVFQRFIRCGAHPSYQFSELAMMVEYFQSLDVGRGSTVRGIISGAFSEDDQMIEELADILGMPLTKLDTPFDAKWCLCAGAARTNMDFGISTLNSVVNSRSKVRSELWQYGLILVGGLAVIAVVATLLTSRLDWNTEISTLENQQIMLMAESKKYDGFADNYNEYETLYAAYSKDWDTIFASLQVYNDNLVLVMEELENLLPEDSTVLQMEIAPDRLNVTFACENKEDAAYLIKAMREEMQYADVIKVTNLEGGGKGAATSYGSGDLEDEAPPSEGGSTSSSILDEVSQSAVMEIVFFDEQKDTLNNIYGKQPEASYALTDLRDMGGSYDSGRVTALENLMRTNPFAMDRFTDLAVADAQKAYRWETSILGFSTWMAIYQENGGNVPARPQNMAELNALIDVFLRAIGQDDERISGIETLIAQDSSLETAYIHYLEVAMGLRDAEAFPYLDTGKLAQDGEFKTGTSIDDELNALLSDVEQPPATEPPATEPPVTEPPETEPPETEPGDDDDSATPNLEYAGTLFNNYLNGGNVGSQYNKWFSNYITTGKTGNTELNNRLDAYVEGMNPRNGVLYKLIYKYLNGEQLHTYNVVESMIGQFCNTGSYSGNNNKLKQALQDSYDYAEADYDAAQKKKEEAKNTDASAATEPVVIDKRIRFTAVLAYNEELRNAELNRKGLSYSDKIEHLEVDD